MLGNHCIARSSAESELYAIVRASCEALGLVTLMKDLGANVGTRIHVDVSAAKSIVERQGLSRLRHIDDDIL